MKIRNAVEADFPAIMEIYARARRFMASHGNPHQWGDTCWPPEVLIHRDIEAKKSYVCDMDGTIAAVFFYDFGADIEPTYRAIEDGAWESDAPYGVVHRIASAGICKGAGQACIQWAFAQSGHLRIDTHPDNLPMQALLSKLGFSKQGIIHVVEDDYPRFAYEK